MPAKAEERAQLAAAPITGDEASKAMERIAKEAGVVPLPPGRRYVPPSAEEWEARKAAALRHAKACGVTDEDIRAARDAAFTDETVQEKVEA